MCNNKTLVKVNQERKQYAENLVINGIKDAEKGYRILRDEQLYLDEYPTFEEYCVKKLNKSVRQIQRMITHDETKEKLSEANQTRPIGRIEDKVVQNMSEGATRELSNLPIEKQLEIVTKASQNGTKTPTAKEIKAVKEDAKPQVEPTANPTQETETVTILKTEYDNLKNTKNSQTPKNCPHCHKDPTKPPVKQEVKQVFERSSAKSEMDDFFSKTA